MSTLLHLDSAAWDRKVNFTQYAAVAAELLHSSRDAIEALTAFRDLAFHPTVSSTSPTASWLDFDAHPGDCACQIRPAGLHLIVCAFRSDRKRTEDKLQDTLDRLLHVASVAEQTFHQLCTLNLNVSKIGTGLDRKSMLLKDFCHAIGAGAWFDRICQQDIWLAACPLERLSPSSLDDDGSKKLALPSRGCRSENDSISRSLAAFRDNSAQHSASEDSSYETASTPSLSPGHSPASSIKGDENLCSEAILSFPTVENILQDKTPKFAQPKVQFRVDDWSFVVRWIVICFSIGRNRQVGLSKKSDSLVYRIGISDIINKLDARDGEQLQCKNPKGEHRCPHSKAQASVAAKVAVEIEKMQSWTSHASAGLVIRLSQLSCPGTQEVGQNFCVGPRDVGCVPTYLTIQPLLWAWKQLNLPIFIVLKTITENGYTVQYFRATWCDNLDSRSMSIEAVSPTQNANVGDAYSLVLPHAVFYSQRVKIAKNDRLFYTCRHVEEMELEDDVPAALLPDISGANGSTHRDSDDIVRILSDGGLHDKLLGFFAQHCDFPFPTADAKALRAWNLEQQDWVDCSMRYGCNYENASVMVPRHCFYGAPSELMRICDESVRSGRILTVPGFSQALKN